MVVFIDELRSSVLNADYEMIWDEMFVLLSHESLMVRNIRYCRIVVEK